MKRYGIVEADSFAVGLHRTGALTDWNPGLAGDNLEQKSESSITQWQNQMKAGMPANRIPGFYVDSRAMKNARSALRITRMIQVGVETKDKKEISFLGLRLAQGGFGIKGDYEAIPRDGRMRIWIEFQHAPNYPKFTRHPHNWITDPKRRDLHIVAIKLRLNYSC